MGVSNGWNCITVARLFTDSEQIAVRTQKPALNLLILIRSAAKCPRHMIVSFPLLCKACVLPPYPAADLNKPPVGAMPMTDSANSSMPGGGIVAGKEIKQKH